MIPYILKPLPAEQKQGNSRAIFGGIKLSFGLKACLCFGQLLLASAVHAQQPGTPGLTADYYRGYFYDSLSFFTANAPVIRNRPVENLNFAEAETDNFGAGAAATYYQAGQPDEFSGRFQGRLCVTTGGPYTFYLGSDDAAYLWIDNGPQPVACNKGDKLPFRETTGTCNLAPGLHTIRVDYGEHGGSQGLVLQYSGPDMPKQLVPNGVLYGQVNTAIKAVLTSFEAVANNQQVDLKWSTSAEEKSVAFVVQKSTDGVVFTELLRRTGAATTSAPHSYEATDQRPANGWNFYRIEQVRSDRGPVYSPVKAVEIKPQPFAVSIYPVPNSGVFFLQVQPANIETAFLELEDMSGRQVYQQQVVLSGSAVQQIKPDLATGLYILHLTTTAGTLVQKLLVGE